jgi:hypothetical protein
VFDTIVVCGMPQSRATLESCHNSIQDLFGKQLVGREPVNGKLLSYAVYSTVHKTCMNLVAEKGVRAEGVADPQVMSLQVLLLPYIVPKSCIFMSSSVDYLYVATCGCAAC